MYINNFFCVCSKSMLILFLNIGYYYDYVYDVYGGYGVDFFIVRLLDWGFGRIGVVWDGIFVFGR